MLVSITAEVVYCVMRDIYVCYRASVDMPDTPSLSRVKSVDTAFRIIQFLHEEQTGTLNTISKAVDISTSTAYRHLETLRERGYVVVDNNEYRLSLRFLTHGGKTRQKFPAHEMIDRKIHQISEETSERVQFITEEHGERVYLYTHAGDDAVRTDARIGKRGPLHVSAAGKAILANITESRREEIISEATFREGTNDSRGELIDELATVRERGYAFNDEESTMGLRAVGVPVIDESGGVLGAVSLSGPANRLRGEYFREEIPNLLLGAVNEIELNLQYS